MKKTKVLVLLLLSFALLLGGCSSKETTSESEDGKTVLTFFHRWPKEPEKTYFNDVVKEFEKQHPDIKIKTEAVLNDSYKDKIKVMTGTNNPPDIYFSWSDEFARQFVRGNKALDLTSYYEKDAKWSSQLVQSQVKPYTVDQKIYGVPVTMDGKMFFYNKSIFEKLNLQPPTTWDELINVLKVLKKNGYTPLQFGSQDTWTISHYVGTLNQRIVKEDVLAKDYKNETGKFTDKGYIQALEKFEELTPYFNKNTNSIDHEYARQQFSNGKAAMIFAETAEIKLFGPIKFELGMFNFPKVEDGKGNQTNLTGAPEGFMISSKTKHPKEAMEFLKFLASKDMGEKLVKDVGKYSAVQNTANSENTTPEQLDAVDNILKAEEMAPWFDMAIDSRIADAYLTGTQLMLNGDKTPKQVMKDVQKAANSVRAESKK
ncbi:ABC transporter substrate-binding protein [Priestia filamentosa]|uniref:Sugar ABC transporter substrate-binding protein n=1 Tax=Priestia filamentosa TaxID=1402861 RepID=A0A1X7EKY8_9BACI|nr:extracellular solute-binding protein [Priestia filamentosa]AKO93080.1 sugar ABC transporter substrate-binding protein [Priestia filamentosa]MDT3763205.1 extracellular solute-binding protein [Priestia filamentosa]OXS69713.1 sugar ABC transporter substrate-binding protein [Priestia filamentosa]RJS63626.1 sugar ABC transporter substrate-binding protein [Priestia filamentosa]WRU93679.1 extracellular solute-binding protein [Priestia filamentosa]